MDDSDKYDDDESDGSDDDESDDESDDDIYEVYPRPGFVYKFTWPGTAFVYIGSTFCLRSRFKTHRKRAWQFQQQGAIAGGHKLYDTIQKHPNWIWECLFRGLVNSERELRVKEQEFIDAERETTSILLNTCNVAGVNKNSKAEGNHRRYIEKKAEIDARNTAWMNKRVACPHCPEDEYGPQTYSQGYLKAHIRRRHPEVEQTDRRRTE